jgi:hypothetical protein
MYRCCVLALAVRHGSEACVWRVRWHCGGPARKHNIILLGDVLQLGKIFAGDAIDLALGSSHTHKDAVEGEIPAGCRAFGEACPLPTGQ